MLIITVHSGGQITRQGSRDFKEHFIVFFSLLGYNEFLTSKLHKYINGYLTFKLEGKASSC